MANSLLAYLYPHIRGSQEDVATLSLSYLLSQSSAIKSAFTKQICNRLSLPYDESINYITQSVGVNKERPDIVGFDGAGKERIICEVKFYAALTANQPQGYLQRLKDVQKQGVIFICPQARQTGLWNHLQSLVADQAPIAVSEYCVEVNGNNLAIINWLEVLSNLHQIAENSDHSVLEDLNQLIGYCQQMDSDSYAPFRPEDFGADVAKNMDRYYIVIDKAADILMSKKERNPSTKGLRSTPQWLGLTRYIAVSDFRISIEFHRKYWKSNSSVYTPFWLGIRDSDWKQSETIKHYLTTIPDNYKESAQNGGVFIALIPEFYKTMDETAQDLVEQILNHLDRCENMKS